MHLANQRISVVLGLCALLQACGGKSDDEDTPPPASTPPTITDIADRSTPEDTATGAIAFTVGDAETAAGSLTLTATSSNTALVPVANIGFGGTGASRTVSAMPLSNASGTATITVTVSDGQLTASDAFVLTVTAVNDEPTISNLANQTTNVGVAVGPLAFTVADPETAAGSLTLSAASSNTGLVPVANVVFGGTGANRTVTVTPVAAATGTTTITVTVSDGQLTASETFDLTVAAVVNTPPTISSISDRTTTAGVAVGPLAFTVGDAQTAAANLTLSAASADTALVPVTNIVFGGSGANRTVTVTPAAGVTGTAEITLSVSDGVATASTSFDLTVTPTVGLDSRPSNLTCLAPVRNTGGGATIALERAFPNLTFEQPLAMLQAPGDDSRWFVLEKTGDVRVFANTPTVSTDSAFISLAVNDAREGGLLGMAFHPNWVTNRYVFLSFTEGSAFESVVARFTLATDGQTLVPSSRVDIIRINQPEDNHNGGQIAFGPEDGLLYYGLGDGGPGGDPNSTGQDTTDLLGSMLRLDVDGALPYEIPPDNPFAGQAVCGPDHTVSANSCPEIYAWGFRNPWRWSFDSATGDLWVGDVGQGELEEIDRVQLGGNYGWDCYEGTEAYGSPASSCSTTTGFIDPVHEYGRTLGGSVTGGYVYRGSAVPALVGQYVFADYLSGRIWRLVSDGSGGYDDEELLDTSLPIASFGEGNDGELYVIDIGAGELHAIVDGGGVSPGPPVATQLSATGCVDPQDPSQPAPGLIPYAPSAPFWSDNAVKERWLALPNSTAIARAGDGDFTFPSGSVLVKNFRLNNTLIETRLFMRHPDGGWAGYSYEWNGQGTDATLVQGGKSVTIGGQTWVYPSENDCLSCHTSAAGFTLGLEAAQLNDDFFYASTGRTANQLRTLDHIALFSTPLGDPALQPSMPDPFDATAPLDQRARAYLHTNCSQCHRPGGPAPTTMDLRYSTLLSNMAACDAPPQSGDLGIGSAARIIAPGSPANSVLVARVNRRDANGMPPLASTIVDAAGVTLLSNWIAGLSTCQ